MTTLDSLATSSPGDPVALRVARDDELRHQLARELWRSKRPEAIPLGTLRPGLSDLPAPPPLRRGASVRTYNALTRAGFDSWLRLAAAPTTEILHVPNFG